jgi:hypothetical protein
MAMPRQSKALREAMHSGRFVRFYRRFEDSSIRGYVLDVGPEFFLLSLVSDRVRFDGFECFRISDVRNLRSDPYAKFAETALKKRGEHKPKKPSINITNVGALLVSASRVFPLVTIHRERIEPDICHIGRVLNVGDDCLSLLEIGPDAQWDDSATEYRIREITRVNFGGDYEDALHVVGDAPGKNQRR